MAIPEYIKQPNVIDGITPVEGERFDNIEQGIYDNREYIRARPNPNLLINGNFDRWQRGTSFTGSGYKADRWEGVSSLSTYDRVANDSPALAKYKMVIGVLDTVAFRQKIENPNNVLYNKTSTLSFWVKGSIATTENAVLRNDTQGLILKSVAFDITTVWTKVEVVFDAFTDWVADDIIELRLLSGFSETMTIEFAQVKFEVGDVATEYIPEQPKEYIQKPKRYAQFQRETTGGNGLLIGTGFAVNSSTLRIPIALPVELRVAPTFSKIDLGGGLIRARGNGQNINMQNETFTTLYKDGLLTLQISQAVGTMIANETYALEIINYELRYDAEI